MTTNNSSKTTIALSFASIVILFLTIVGLSLVSSTTPGVSDPPPVPTSPSPVPPDDPANQPWNWQQGAAVYVIEAIPFSPEAGKWYTCINGPIEIFATLRDSDMWKNYSTVWYADDEITMIKVIGNGNGQPEYGSYTTQPSDRLIHPDDTITYSGIVECIIPGPAGTRPVRFRGVDKAKYGNDTFDEGEPPLNYNEVCKCEDCDDCCNEVTVFHVIVTVTNNEYPGFVNSFGPYICSNSTNGRTGKVEVDLYPHFTGWEDVLITVEIDDTNLVIFDNDQSSMEISGNSPGYIRTIDNAYGTAHLTPKFVVNGVSYECARPYPSGIGKVNLYKYEAYLDEVNCAPNSRPRSEPTPVPVRRESPTPVGNSQTDMYWWNVSPHVDEAHGGYELTGYGYYSAVGSTHVQSNTLDKGVDGESDGEVYNEEWGGRSSTTAKLKVRALPGIAASHAVTINGKLHYNNILMLSQTLTDRSGVTVSKGLSYWGSFSWTWPPALGGSEALAYVNIKAGELNERQTLVAHARDTSDPNSWWNLSYSGNYTLNLGQYFDIGLVGGDGIDVVFEAGATCIRSCEGYQANSHVHGGNLEIEATSYTIH